MHEVITYVQFYTILELELIVFIFLDLFPGKSVVKNQKHPVDFQVDSNTKTLPDSVNSPKFRWEIMRSRDPEGYRNIEV